MKELKLSYFLGNEEIFKIKLNMYKSNDSVRENISLQKYLYRNIHRRFICNDLN